MAEQSIIMPDKEELMRRLRAVDDGSYLIERFYPQVIRTLAGQRVTGLGVVLAFQVAVADYTEGMGMPDQVARTMKFIAKELIKGIFIGNQAAILSDAMTAYNKVS